MDIGSLASWFGALISLLTAGFAVWWNWHTRPEASWSVTALMANVPSVDVIPGLRAYVASRGFSEPGLVVTATNDGDGDAYQVSVDGVGCRVTTLQRTGIPDRPFVDLQTIPRIPIGEHMILLVWLEPIQDAEQAIRFHWVLQPTRSMKAVRQDYFLNDRADRVQPRRPLPEPEREAGHLSWATETALRLRIRLSAFAHRNHQRLSRSVTSGKQEK
ncbi:hypothetical protein [Bifidobacterium sp. ESL0790]|uniref:hypothetical protein n=1 Tax=Bifidobacterium sp. ESL0790 TaxID=2983233 RepID=UPI0023F7E60D|nr:hypothetical protein [Bifidobacterium sp. ESL0790]WEV72119.1 hypothetical protein OZY47_06680 [Bifidobacterium sp. ESL0790]